MSALALSKASSILKCQLEPPFYDMSIVPAYKHTDQGGKGISLNFLLVKIQALFKQCWEDSIRPAVLYELIHYPAYETICNYLLEGVAMTPTWVWSWYHRRFWLPMSFVLPWSLAPWLDSRAVNLHIQATPTSPFASPQFPFCLSAYSFVSIPIGLFVRFDSHIENFSGFSPEKLKFNT